MSKQIKLSEIKNHQNMAVTKSGDMCIIELLLRRLKTQKRGKKPTLYYKGMEVIPDVNKDDIERIIYCQRCGHQEVTDEWTDGMPCPHCGDSHLFGYEGFRIKGTLHKIYGDNIWESFKDEIKDRYRWILKDI